ncbi:MAG: PotD/PotF family extracellular solute-binding protein [Kiloniellales bacterium]
MRSRNSSGELTKRRLSRRQMLELAGAAGLTVAMMPVIKRPAQAAGQALYFTWGGYDIPELFGPYTAKHGEPPEFATYGDSEEGLTKMRAGYVVDVAHPCNQSIPRWVDTGLFQPIDTSKLSNWNDVVPSLKVLDSAQKDGKQYFVPFEWGQTSITYRTDLFDLQGQEESWDMLWDERYKGKLMVIGSAGDAWWCAAILAGVDFDSISDDDVETVNALLRKQQPLVRLYTSDVTTMQQALASGEVVAGMTWNDTATALKAEGVPVKFANPKEGALTWACGVMLHKDAPNYDKAHDVIDSMISPEVGEYVITEFGYGHSNAKSFDLVDEATLAELGLTRSPNDILDRGVFQTTQSDDLLTRINRDFEEIMAGF